LVVKNNFHHAALGKYQIQKKTGYARLDLTCAFVPKAAISKIRQAGFDHQWQVF
jgi:hypothetical protein